MKRALVEGSHQPEAIVTDVETPPASDTQAIVTEAEDEEEPTSSPPLLAGVSQSGGLRAALCP